MNDKLTRAAHPSLLLLILPTLATLSVIIARPSIAQNGQTQSQQGAAASTQPKPTPAPEDRSHYPYRVPDWLWRDERRTAFINEKLRKELDYEIEILRALQKMEDSTAADEKELAIAKKLSSSLALRDLTADAICFSNQSKGTKLCLQIDPAFDPASKATLVKGAQLFLEFALDDHVIQDAFDQSVIDPQPMPDKYKTKEGRIESDKFGNQVFTDDYRFYLSTIPRPRDVASFKAQLHSALTSPNGDPALLAISRYTGGVWWGAGWYDFSLTSEFQLSRLAPVQGFLYIRLNADRLKEGVTGWNDPAFWASKISHECLHNLGYWHPVYKDPEDRDRNNPPKKMAFIVAYERSLLRRISQRR